jgi:hypothetical protein
MTDATLEIGETTPEISEEAKTEETVRADTVHINGGVAQVQARVVNVQQGGIGRASGDALTVTLTQGGIGAMVSRQADVTVNNGGIGAIAAQDATVHNAVISVLAATRVKLEGNTRVLIDLRAGLLFGVIVGVMLSASNIVLHMVRPLKRSSA